MKHLLFILLGFAGLAIAAYGFVKSNSESENRKKAEETAKTATELTRTAFEGQSIDALRIGFAFRVSLKQGDRTGVRVSFDSRFEPYLICKLDGGVLTLDMQTDRPQYLNYGQYWVAQPTAEITIRSFSELGARGASRVVAEGTFAADRLRINTSGAAKIEGLDLRVSGPVDVDCSGASRLSDIQLGTPSEVEIDVSGAAKLDFACDTRKLDIQASGASKIEGTGTTDRMKIRVSGAASASLDKMKALSADCSTSGAARLECRATNVLHASASGSSSIRYRADGSIRTVFDRSGASRIEAIR